MVEFADHVKETDPVRLQFKQGGGIEVKAELTTEDMLKEWYNRKLLNNKEK